MSSDSPARRTIIQWATLGELNPLSNFHPTNFTVDGIHYTSSEQFVQCSKALLFKDYVTANKIINATNALECKELSREIVNFDKSTWEERAKKLCKPGIQAKFHQNSCLSDVLIHCTGDKQIIESAKDKIWGTGIPLHDDDCLNPRKWLSRGPGIMGEILTEIREELRLIPMASHANSKSNLPNTPRDNPNQQQSVLISDQKIDHSDVNTESASGSSVMEH